jgi:hypothetical protein
MTRSGVADQPERSNQFLRTFPLLMGSLRVISRPVAWLLTACNLPAQLGAQLRTLWRWMAREMTEPRFHRFKKPRKAKSPRPF